VVQKTEKLNKLCDTILKEKWIDGKEDEARGEDESATFNHIHYRRINKNHYTPRIRRVPVSDTCRVRHQHI